WPRCAAWCASTRCTRSTAAASRCAPTRSACTATATTPPPSPAPCARRWKPRASWSAPRGTRRELLAAARHPGRRRRLRAGLNPALVVVVAGIATGLLAGIAPGDVLALIGQAASGQRYLALFLLTLPAIGLLERHGLKERGQRWIARLRGATAGRALAAYRAGRQLLSALGLVDLGGHAQTVRPLMAPMAVGAADHLHGPLPEEVRERIKAMTAASENVGRFFGEDVFIAFGAVLLMQGFFAGHGIDLEPLHIALWGIPTAICAFLIHAGRLLRMDARLAREAAALRA